MVLAEVREEGSRTTLPTRPCGHVLVHARERATESVLMSICVPLQSPTCSQDGTLRRQSALQTTDQDELMTFSRIIEVSLQCCVLGIMHWLSLDLQSSGEVYGRAACLLADTKTVTDVDTTLGFYFT